MSAISPSGIDSQPVTTRQACRLTALEHREDLGYQARPGARWDAGQACDVPALAAARAPLRPILNRKCPLADNPACKRVPQASLSPEAEVRLGGQRRCWSAGTGVARGRTVG